MFCLDSIQDPLPYKKLHTSNLKNDIQTNYSFFPDLNLNVSLNFLHLIANKLSFMDDRPTYFMTENKNLCDSFQNSFRSTDNTILNINHHVKKEKKAQNIKYPQSKFKNSYGLTLGRVIKTSKDYLRLKEDQLNLINETSRFHYIHSRIGNFDSQEKESFKKFIILYHSQNKGTTRNRGKSAVKSYLMQDLKNGILLCELVQDFLQKKNPDFHNYIFKGERIASKTAKVLADDKNLNQLRENFEIMETELRSCSMRKVSNSL